MKTFTILGAGWLGLALAKVLHSSFKVKVSRSKENKKKYLDSLGLESYLFNENDFSFLDELLETDFLIINYPPSKFENYNKFLLRIYRNKKISTISKIIFISSTSIYPNEDAFFNEEYNIINPLSKIVFQAENIIKDKTDVIFRCAGLMGYHRIAGKYFSGKVLDSKNSKANYIHRDDIISAIKFVVLKDINGVFNLCSKEHPLKKEVYDLNAKNYSFEKPIYKNTKEYKNRVIDSSKLEGLGFVYKYSNPLKYPIYQY